jgi:ribonucleotide monophosphatase NagD (HAD superfamily)
VEWVGKPHPAIFRFALDAVAPGGERPPIVMVGDSVEHDVAGARGAGVDAAFLTCGIHADVPRERLPDLFREHGATPDWVLSGLSW